VSGGLSGGVSNLGSGSMTSEAMVGRVRSLRHGETNVGEDQI
jgi:hypothetical protein